MKKPNVLIFMCDQLQKRPTDADSECITPAIDRVAENGMRFNRAFTSNAVCSPARAGLMTGLLPHNHGVLYVTHVVDDDQACLRTQHPHFAQHLQNDGYHTGYFGKWHVERSHELERFGWQVNMASATQAYKQAAERLTEGNDHKPHLVWSKTYDMPGYKNQPFYGVTDTVPEQRPMGLVTSMAIDYLSERETQPDPWCCFVSISEPHDPFICGRDAYRMYDKDMLTLPQNVQNAAKDRPNLYKKAARIWQHMTDDDKKEAMACYYASITEIDAQLMRILDKLEQMQALEDTIIIVTTDHGELLGAHGLYCKNFSAYEEVYNIPLILSGPNIPKGVRTDAAVSGMDLAPTITDMVGAEPIVNTDSRSFASLFGENADPSSFDTVYAESFGGRIIYTQRIVWHKQYKYVFNGFDFDELYDLSNDPYEMHNRMEDPAYASIAQQMTERMWEFVKNTGDHSLFNLHYPILRLPEHGPLYE